MWAALLSAVLGSAPEWAWVSAPESFTPL
jgi:hypothetical protein